MEGSSYKTPDLSSSIVHINLPELQKAGFLWIHHAFHRFGTGQNINQFRKPGPGKLYRYPEYLEIHIPYHRFSSDQFFFFLTALLFIPETNIPVGSKDPVRDCIDMAFRLPGDFKIGYGARCDQPHNPDHADSSYLQKQEELD